MRSLQLHLGVLPVLLAVLCACGDDKTNDDAAATPTATASSTPSATPTAINPASACRALSGTTIGAARILSTNLVNASGANPQYCRVNARIDAALNFEVRLPSNWNDKAVFIGGGGYNGIIGSPDDNGRSPGILARGFASIATDSGHRGTAFDASWALADQEAVDNFAYLSTHRVLLAAREIIAARYGRALRRAYFEGGSTGGREALIAAQRWPADFDGITAREPVHNFTALMLAIGRVAKQIYRAPGGFLDDAAVRTVAAAVLSACDNLDGLADGIVSNQAACTFDPQVLSCPTAAPQADCLTAAQINSVALIHTPVTLGFNLANGVGSHPGWPLGGEDTAAGWPLWITAGSPEMPGSFAFTLYDQFIRYFVTKDPDFDSLQFEPADHRAALQSLSDLMDATNPDLSAFRARGGKLILWHGWSDYGVSAYSTIDYYQQAVAAAGGQANADSFVRLYLSPGVDHTGGGAGAPYNDFLTPIDAWVEDGSAPGDLIGYQRHPETNELVPFRPLCRYPAYPHYNGGEPMRVESFECR